MEPLLRRMWRAATVGATTIVARPTIELQEEGSQCSTHIVYKQGGLPSRPVEYLQSLIASTNNTMCLHVTDEDIERLAHQYLHDQEMLFEKATQYLMFRSLVIEDDSETSCLVFEAQMMHMVRGNRYRFLQLD